VRATSAIIGPSGGRSRGSTDSTARPACASRGTPSISQNARFTRTKRASRSHTPIPSGARSNTASSSALASASARVRSATRASSTACASRSPASLRRRSATSACRSACARCSCSTVGIASARGSSHTSTPAVGTDTAAVTAFTEPDSQYIGCQTVHTSMKCVRPQATMNAANSSSTWSKGSSWPRRRSSTASVNGIDT
jgi:hypothetical protein